MPKPLSIVEKLQRREQVTIVFVGDSNTALTFHTHGFLNVVGLVECGLFLKFGNTRSRVINAAQCGEGVNGVIARLDDDVIRLRPDLVIVGYGMTSWRNGDTHLQAAYIQPMRELVRRVRDGGAEVILRTSNPIVCVNQPSPGPGEVAGHEWPNDTLRIFSRALVELARELDCPVVDHYRMWLEQTYPPNNGVNNPNGLWLRMSDLTHPNEIGHRAFYRELAPLLGLPTTLPWEM